MKRFTDSNEIGPNVHHLLNKLCELVGPAAASLTARQLSPHFLVRPGPTGTELSGIDLRLLFLTLHISTVS